MTLDHVLVEIRTLATRWQGDSTARRKLWPDDPVAATLSHAAGELTAELSRLGLETARCSVVEYADLRGVTPQCVRRWIRLGYLQASKGPDGYSISRTARVIRKAAA